MPLGQMPALEMTQNDTTATITGSGFEIRFDKAAGRMDSFVFQETELLHSGPLLNAWRAATDNDAAMIIPETNRPLNQWLAAGLDRLDHHTQTATVEQIRPQLVRIQVVTRVNAKGIEDGFIHRHTYHIYGSSDVVIENVINASPNLPALPRTGLTMQVSSGFERFTWYGRGPHENYIDRNVGAALGLYSGSVDEQYVPYIMPQENGNKTDVRWFTLTNEQGVGLLASGSRPLEVSVSHFTAADLHQAQHTNALVRRNEVAVNLDYMQSGLGGASCGPGTLPHYLLQPGDFTFSVRLRPFVTGEVDPVHLSREQLETVSR